jgi:protocatechuate 3,4-dioxygenase alpha subunit
VNAILELWQADGAGAFGLWGRTWTDDDGLYRFLTLKPGPHRSSGNRPRAPYINVMVHASGVMRPLVTQLFFPGEPPNDEDPQLSLVSPGRRSRLIAQAWRDPQAPAEALALRFDIALAGPNETPFLAD